MSKIICSDYDGGGIPLPLTTKEKLLQAWQFCAIHPNVDRDYRDEMDGIYRLTLSKEDKVFMMNVFINHNGYRINVPTSNEGEYLSKDEYEDCVKQWKGKEKELLGVDRVFEVL